MANPSSRQEPFEGQPAAAYLNAAELTHPGYQRSDNQDAIRSFESRFGSVFLVADGMGGHEGGAVAAKMAIEGFESAINHVPQGWRVDDALREAARLANDSIRREGTSGNPATKNMGSTIVSAVIRGGTLRVGHIGDSRAYLFRRGRLRRLTSDHSKVQKLVNAKLLSETDARKHPDANQLTRCLGQEQAVEIDVSGPIPLRNGDTVMLCTDGLWGYVARLKIEQAMRDDRVSRDVAERLVQLALDAGAPDNVSVIAIKVGRHNLGVVRKTALAAGDLVVGREKQAAIGALAAAVILAAGVGTWGLYQKERRYNALAIRPPMSRAPDGGTASAIAPEGLTPPPPSEPVVASTAPPAAVTRKTKTAPADAKKTAAAQAKEPAPAPPPGPPPASQPPPPPSSPPPAVAAAPPATAAPPAPQPAQPTQPAHTNVPTAPLVALARLCGSCQDEKVARFIKEAVPADPNGVSDEARHTKYAGFFKNTKGDLDLLIRSARSVIPGYRIVLVQLDPEGARLMAQLQMKAEDILGSTLPAFDKETADYFPKVTGSLKGFQVLLVIEDAGK